MNPTGLHAPEQQELIAIVESTKEAIVVAPPFQQGPEVKDNGPRARMKPLQ
ncbi:MAG: hypothetical protein ACJ8AW_30330 [Rhodopila sp.]